MSDSYTELQAFKDMFVFASEYTHKIGIERECFLLDSNKQHVARAKEALDHIHTKVWDIASSKFEGLPPIDVKKCVGYELSALQLETRTPVISVDDAERYLSFMDTKLRNNLAEIGLYPSYIEVAPVKIPLTIYPDPSGRYQKISTSMTLAVKRAACRIIGTHIHVGVRNHEMALKVYNKAVENVERLTRIGDGSNGERLRLYGVVKPDHRPRPYRSWSEFHEDALEQGFADNPRNNWCTVRITRFGTVETRAFGASVEARKNARWARACHALSLEAME